MHPMKNQSNQTWPILVLFFCSGATALIYEVIWSKFLAQMFGSTIYAQTVVLAVFMGGLALGNQFFGLKADLLKKPVRAYGRKYPCFKVCNLTNTIHDSIFKD